MNIAKKIKYTGGTVRSVFDGTYRGNIAELCRAIEQFERDVG